MLKKILYTCSLIALACVNFSTPSVVQASSNAECIDAAEAVNLKLLPSNLRFISPNFDKNAYSLVNPYDQTNSVILNTQSLEYPGFPFLFDDGKRMFYIHKIEGEKWAWQTMELDGTSTNILKYSSHPPYTHILNDDSILFDDSDIQRPIKEPIIPYKLLNLATSDISSLAYPKFQNFVPLDGINYPNMPRRFLFNASGDHLAYLAYRTDADGHIVYGPPYLIRVQDTTTNHFVDLLPTGYASESFDWSYTSNRITVLTDHSTVEIFDAQNGNILYTILPPDNQFRYEAAGVTWSPDKRQLAIEWDTNIHILDSSKRAPYNAVLAIYNLNSGLSFTKCFKVTGYATDENSDGRSTFHWVAEQHIIWWLACPTINNDCPDNYTLMVLDLNNENYGALATGLNISSAIGFLK